MSILPALLGIGALGLGAAQGNAASKKLERQMRELAGFSKSGQDVYGPGFNFKRGPQGYVTDFSSPFQSQLTSIGKQARQLAQDGARLRHSVWRVGVAGRCDARPRSPAAAAVDEQRLPGPSAGNGRRPRRRISGQSGFSFWCL